MRAVLLLLLLTGCSARAVGGNENSVIIAPANDSNAFGLAAEHCKRYGKTPRLTGTERAGSRYYFDCI